MLGLALLFGVAIYDPPIAAGIARLSFALTGTVGIVLIAYLGFNRYDRAILLVPAWALILVWLFGVADGDGPATATSSSPRSAAASSLSCFLSASR